MESWHSYLPGWAKQKIKIAVCGAACVFLFGAILTAHAQRRQQTRRVRSYVGPNSHVMVIIPGGTFTMGSPLTEPGRSQVETQHRVKIPRRYAIATTEVTNDHFRKFLEAVSDYATRWQAATAVRFGDPPRFKTFSRTPDSPQVAVSWYDAARYCNWFERACGHSQKPVGVSRKH